MKRNHEDSIGNQPSQERSKNSRAEYMRRYRASQSHAQMSQRRSKDAAATRRMRSQETEEDTARRREQSRDRYRSANCNINVEERSRMRHQMLERTSVRIQNESENDRRRRLEYARNRFQTLQATETEVERNRRLTGIRQRAQVRIDNETDEARNKRLSDIRQRAQVRIENENDDARNQRLSDSRQRTQVRIENENDDTRNLRLTDSRQRTQVRIENENDDARNQRLTDSRQRVQVRIDNETENERVARLEHVRHNATARLQATDEFDRNLIRQANAENMRVARRNMQQIISFNNNIFTEGNVLQHSAGDLNVSCQFCSAKHFLVEKPSDGLFNNCCHKGRVLYHPRRAFPEYLQNVFSDPDHPHYANFKNNIRSYNSALSFASMGAQISEAPGRGPYCFKVHGQIYHQTSNIHPVDGSERQFAQLYVVDSSMANQTRLNHQANRECVPIIIANLDRIIRENNVYAMAYRMMKEVEQEEDHIAELENRESETVTMVFNRASTLDRRRYNAPTVDEVAMVFRNADGAPPFERDFRVYPRNNNDINNRITLNILSSNLDPMTYALFYPYGEPGWQPNLRVSERRQRDNGRNNITMLQHKISQISIRDDFNPILHGGKLFQQWAVDSHLQVEANNLNYVRYHQNQLRVENYTGLADHIANNNEAQVGRIVILPSTFQGSPRNMKERYHDAMSMVSKYGKPDLFITMTSNPSWPEIQNNLYPGQNPSDRPDLIARVFKIKLNSLIDDVVSKSCFGKVVAFCYSIEFQKRGLPHAHILIILENKELLSDPGEVDKIVCAEIPDPVDKPVLFAIVTKCHIHGPCGADNPNARCMVNNKCSKGFYKKFQDSTDCTTDSYPLYRRRRTPPHVINNRLIDNRSVVPYNQHLTYKYNCHINVEVCSSIYAVKYIFKYIYKGYDCAEMEIAQGGNINHDEIVQYLNGRYVSAPEAMWRLLENKMHDKSHSVIRLQVHLENRQAVYFQEGNERGAFENAQQKNTPLTAWLHLNQIDANAQQYTYPEIPYHYVFDKRTSSWKKRIRGSNKIISRLYSVHPNDTERFHLRLLLLHIKGPKSFEDIRTHNGILHDTYKAVAESMNLLDTDEEWSRCLQEATEVRMPAQLRELFAVICALNRPNDPRTLFIRFEQHLTEDLILAGDNQASARNKALYFIEQTLILHGLRCEDIGLPHCDVIIANLNEDIVSNENLDARIATLNDRQSHAFHVIVDSLDNINAPHRFFFLDGPGGSGKTYLYNTIISYCQTRNKLVLSYATTGIAADLLTNGRTVHSGFRLPVPLLDTSVSSMKIPSSDSENIKNASLLIVDEASMLSGQGLRIMDQLLKSIMNNMKPFGGKVLLLGGDFRQTACVIRGGSNADVIENCIKQSPLWQYVTRLQLAVNIRANGSDGFIEWLLKVGDGELNDAELDANIIEIPQEMVVTENITNVVYGDSLSMDDYETYIETIANKTILTPKNSDALNLNNKVLNLLPGEATTYKSVDTVISDDAEQIVNYPVEFLNKISLSGLPPHELKLKIGSIVMLIRNINPRNGMLNGTRLVIKSLQDNYITAQIITGSRTGDTVFLPRIDLTPSDTSLPFSLKRRQLPVIPSFAMTINKSQGQSFNTVGIYLPKPVFSHGQLYVALSRIRDHKNMKIQIENCDGQGNLKGNSEVYTKNVVLKELLE